MNAIQDYLEKANNAMINNQLIHIQLANKRMAASDLKSVHIKPIQIKKGKRLSFVYRYNTRDVTKNYVHEEALNILSELMNRNFYQATLTTVSADIFLNIKKNGSSKIKEKPTKGRKTVNLEHDHKKNRIIGTNNPYLHALGITTTEGRIKKENQAKYKQINRYIELLEDSIKSLPLKQPYHIADMGSGKGYLTFALYDYLTHKLGHKVNLTGIEMREDLVQKCNEIAESCEYESLTFELGTIQENRITEMDIVVALHACDTATDDAIGKAILASAQMIVCSPCCHKQIRKQMIPPNVLSKVAQFGILKERQSELITDTIRAMILQAFGYQTKVIEFVNTEHTPKNLLIIATKKGKNQTMDQSILNQVNELKKLHGIDFHYLEKVLKL